MFVEQWQNFVRLMTIHWIKLNIVCHQFGYWTKTVIAFINIKATEDSIGTIQMDLSYSIWSRQQTKIEGVLGPDFGGKFANCQVITHKKTNDEGVMKIVWKADMRKTNSGWKRVMNERLVWQKVSPHPYTLALKGFFETEAAYCFVTEHIRGLVSLSVVTKSAPLPEEGVKYLSGQLAVALNHLHVNGILHRSLSPDCILIEKCGRLRLCDFETAKLCEFSCRPFGECSYLAPEIIQGKEYGKEADWWSFAIIILEMMLGNTPLDIYCDKMQITDDNEVNTEVLLRGTNLFELTLYLLYNQGSGIGGGRGGYTPPGRKNFENTPPPWGFGKNIPPPLGGAKRRRHFFDQILEINVNLTGFRLNLVKLTLI